ncbi:MAG TPA: DNA topoisomerase IB [Gemmatimonadales bacterium]|nr:DNA topoisomerase IB [Gemmatimonadales bacterium]
MPAAARKAGRRWKGPAAGRGARRGRSRIPKEALDPQHAAESAGLRYVSDAQPGIRRRRAGKGFSYVGPDGRIIRDAPTLARIRALAIPPAYSEVWICPDPNGHIQATGRDARRRKQYRYHPRWREVRDETKFGRMLAFSEVLPCIRRQVEQDLRRTGLPREKVLATVVRLLECTGIRVGNDEYARTNDSFGLTTLRDDHVEVAGSTMTFSFRGKSGKDHSVELSDRRLARIVSHCQSLPGEELFQYVDEAGEQQTIGSGDVNEYLKGITGQEFTAKDFRTWNGTILAVAALRELGPAATQREVKSAIVKAVDRVADRLNNTRAVCRKYYVHPAVFETYAAGTMIEALANGDVSPATEHTLSAEEEAIVRLLRRKG